jgi:hypothetical protein
MARTGIDNPWRDEGEPEPDPLDEWLAEGFERADAEVWRSWRFTRAQAKAWRAAGVEDGLRAAQWATARATPRSVGEWQAASIDANEAVQWHEFGFDVSAAKRHKAQGRRPADAYQQGQHGALLSFVASAPGTAVPPAHLGGTVQRLVGMGVPMSVLQSYAARQWYDDEAVAWAEQHIEAADAQLWKALGLRPREAGRIARRGVDALSVVRDWWKAGIPFEEVAEWLGAALSAEEAAAQRARGITVEQAAALRALRIEDDE